VAAPAHAKKPSPAGKLDSGQKNRYRGNFFHLQSRNAARAGQVPAPRRRRIARVNAGDGKVDGLVRHGRPAEIINHVAEERNASQIFIGRTGDSGLKDILFGSVAGNLVQTASIPVTIIP